jgi:DNA-binding IclR family transcriptional regulator
MKTVAERREFGWRLTDLAAQCGLSKATTYRIVACLHAERIVVQRPGDRRYAPGPLLFELGLNTPAYSLFSAALHADLARLAGIGGNAYLYLRSNDEAVCIDRVSVNAVQPVTHIGRRIPLLRTTFGIAMLLSMPAEEQRRLIVRDGGKKAESDKVRAAYRRVLARSRRHGFGVKDGDTVPGLACIALPITTRDGTPVASIGLTGPSGLLTGVNLREVVRNLRDVVKRIEREHARLIAEIGPCGANGVAGTREPARRRLRGSGRTPRASADRERSGESGSR